MIKKRRQSSDQNDGRGDGNRKNKGIVWPPGLGKQVGIGQRTKNHPRAFLRKRIEFSDGPLCQIEKGLPKRGF